MIKDELEGDGTTDAPKDGAQRAIPDSDETAWDRQRIARTGRAWTPDKDRLLRDEDEEKSRLPR